MKMPFMHMMDHYAGVPLTFLCSLYLRIKHRFKPAPKQLPDPVRNILCIELSEMGSMIHLTLLLDKMKETYPEANIYFATFRSSAPILRILNRVDPDKILTVRSNSFFVFTFDCFRLLFKLARTPFDITFDFELFSRISSLICFFSGAPVKVGFDNFKGEGLYRGNFLTHPVIYNHHHHIVKNFLGMWYALQEPWDDIPHSKRYIEDDAVRLPRFTFDKQLVETFRERLYHVYPVLKNASKLVLLNPNSSKELPLRRWPLASYLALTQQLITTPGLYVAVTGGPEERADAAFICGQMGHPQVVDLSGFTSMAELIALYHFADLMVSNDSGPAQFSALAQMKTITLFGPETPDLYGALNPNAHNIHKRLQCSPCYTAENHRRSACTNNLCMQLITVDEVYGKAQKMLYASEIP